MTASTSPSTAPATGRSGRGILLVVVLALLLGGVVALSGSGTGRPYDLGDSGDSGYKALGLLLERLGAHLDRTDADHIDASLAASTPVAFVPVADAASPTLVRRWRAYARAGGRLVVGTPLPRSGITTDDGAGFFLPDIVAEPTNLCDIGILDDLRSINPAGASPLGIPDGASSCYGGDDAAFVLRQGVGAGAIFTLASPDLFTNGVMRPHNQEVDDPHEPMRDNVVVAQRLLDPNGASRVAIVTSGTASAPSSGHTKGVTAFISPGVKVGLWEVLAAVILLLWWRGRRHGRVVVESQPVSIAGSELVAAVGNMMERRHDPDRAAVTVRRDTARVLGERLGVPRDTDPRLLAAMIAQRSGWDESVVAGPLFATPVHTDADLVAVTSQLESIRQEILHGRQPTAAPAALSGAAATPGGAA